MTIPLRTIHILHVEDLDGKHIEFKPERFGEYPPLAVQLDFARRCCAKPLYAVRVKAKDPLYV